LKKKNEKIRNSQSEITGPMLFARNALASGPQACFLAEKPIAKVKVGNDSPHGFPATGIDPFLAGKL